MTRLFPIIKIFLILGISLLLSGCGSQILKAHSTEEDFLKKEDSRSLVGVQKDLILQKYGTPAWKFNYENNSYFLYTSAGEIDSQLYIIFPVAVIPDFSYDKHCQICALLKFDKTGKLIDIKHTSGTYSAYFESIVSLCIYLLFPRNEAELLTTRYEEETETRD